MFDDPQIAALSRLMDATALSAEVHAQNVANQDTPGYKTRAVSFAEAYQRAMADGDDAAADALQPVIVEPHATPVQADGNDVSMIRETMGMAKDQVAYDSYVALLHGTATLYTNAVSPAPGA